MRYAVDPSEVRALARGLRQAQAAVDDLAGRARSARPFDEMGAALGSALVAAGLSEAEASWSQARHRITRELAGLARAADRAAASYVAVDDAVVSR
jgi:hypothetical protein